MTSDYFGFLATWPTAKTETTELIISGPYGIMSIKVVVSANGKKVQVFSGYDVADWAWPVSPSSPMWEHPYIEAQEKNAQKNGTSVRALGPDAPYTMIGGLDEHLAVAIHDALDHDVKVKAHFNMLTGKEPGVSSRRGADKTPVIPPSVIAQETREVERKQLQLADDGWGRF